MHRVQMVGFPDHLTDQAAGLFEEHADLLPHHRVLRSPLLVAGMAWYGLRDRLGF